MKSNDFDISSLSSIKRKYVLAFGVILLSTLLGQGFIQYYLFKQKSHSYVINISGRQRMLSQRITRFALEIANKRDEAKVEKLKATRKLFYTSHFNLRNGSEADNIAPPFTEEIRRSYIELDETVEKFTNAAICVEQSCPAMNEAIEYLQATADDYLYKMNQIIFASDAYSKKQSVFLALLEVVVFLVIAGVMLVEVFWVLLPFNRSLFSYFQRQIKEEAGREKIYQLAELGEISAEIMHEVNNFMTVIDGTTQLMILQAKKSGKSEHDKEIKKLSKLRESVSKVNEMCVNMSKLSRISFVGEFMLSDVAKDLENVFADKARKYSVKLQVNCHDDVKISSNQAQIAQVLFNLVKNAIQALEKCDDKRVIVDIRYNEQTALADFRVSDSGPGVAPENRDKVTEAFFTTKAPGIGTGLGLSLSKKIARALGGELELIDSEMSTTFRLTILNKKADQMAAPPASIDQAA